MNESDEYALNSIKTWVWSGFYSPNQVVEMIDDILEDDADEAMLKAAVQPEFDRKAVAEASWPPSTDCDRLDQSFESLNSQGIIALHNSGYTMSDGLEDVAEALSERGRNGVKGYCFYHGQDVERALADHNLFVAFGDLDEDKAKKIEIGSFLKDVLTKFDFNVEWNSDPESRLKITGFEWKRRTVRRNGSWWIRLFSKKKKYTH